MRALISGIGAVILVTVVAACTTAATTPSSKPAPSASLSPSGQATIAASRSASPTPMEPLSIPVRTKTELGRATFHVTAEETTGATVLERSAPRTGTYYVRAACRTATPGSSYTYELRVHDRVVSSGTLSCDRQVQVDATTLDKGSDVTTRVRPVGEPAIGTAYAIVVPTSQD